MSVLETMRDLTDDEVIKDAEHELCRASSDGEFAAWARKWGAASISALREAGEEVEAIASKLAEMREDDEAEAG